jgi:hypothetical protein
MSATPTETTSAILARLFRDPDAKLGIKWLELVNLGWTESSLHHQVVDQGTLTATKTKELYGHFRTKTQMKGLVGPYWMQDPMDFVQEETKQLNTNMADSQQRLQQLHTDKIGGVLVLTKIVTELVSLFEQSLWRHRLLLLMRHQGMLG